MQGLIVGGVGEKVGLSIVFYGKEVGINMIIAENSMMKSWLDGGGGGGGR
jgi:hypothetical protein